MAPNVISHNIEAGAVISGVLPLLGTQTPTVPDAPTLGGLVELHIGCSDGGLFEFSRYAPRNGVALNSVIFNGPGTTGFTLSLVSDYGVGTGTWSFVLLEHDTPAFVNMAADPSNFVYQFERPMLVPPGFNLKFESQGALTDTAMLTVCVLPGLGAPAGFVQVKTN